MSSNTPKLGLIKPDPGDLTDFRTQINANYDKIDKARGASSLTSIKAVNAVVSNRGNTVWSAWDTAGGRDVAVKASSGDWVKALPSCKCAGKGAQDVVFLDICIVKAGVLMKDRCWGGGDATDNNYQGCRAWTYFIGDESMYGGMVRQIQADEISGGVVTLRPIYRYFDINTGDLISVWNSNCTDPGSDAAVSGIYFHINALNLGQFT